jgi:hypothetical protein
MKAMRVYNIGTGNEIIRRMRAKAGEPELSKPFYKARMMNDEIERLEKKLGLEYIQFSEGAGKKFTPVVMATPTEQSLEFSKLTSALNDSRAEIQLLSAQVSQLQANTPRKLSPTQIVEMALYCYGKDAVGELLRNVRQADHLDRVERQLWFDHCLDDCDTSHLEKRLGALKPLGGIQRMTGSKIRENAKTFLAKLR